LGLRKHLSLTFAILIANGIAFPTLHDHLYRSRSDNRVLVGCRDLWIPFRKVRVLAPCPYYLVGNGIVCAVLGGLVRSGRTYTTRAKAETARESKEAKNILRRTNGLSLMRTRTLGLTHVIEVYSMLPLYLLVASWLGSMGIVSLPFRLSLKDDSNLLFVLALLFSPYVAVRLLRLHHNRAGTK